MLLSKKTRWRRIVRAFKGKTIGVLGDFMLDEFVRGEATRISPEAPVPVVLINPGDTCAEYPGGAGNVVANIAALDGRAVPLGVTGTDMAGGRLLKALQARGVRCDTLVREPGRTTPRKVRIVAHQHQLLRLDFERVTAISPASASRLLAAFSRWMNRLDALVISDYQKGTITADVPNVVLPLARKAGVPVFVDPKPANPAPCRHATLVTPNLHEAELMAAMPMRTERQLERGGLRLLGELQCDHLLITRSGEGMTLFSAAGKSYVVTSVPRPVYDVTGAGDTVIAVLALAYSAGASLEEAAEMANIAAGRVVLQFGTSQITREELLEAITESVRSSEAEPP